MGRSQKNVEIELIYLLESTTKDIIGVRPKPGGLSEVLIWQGKESQI